MRVCPRCGFVEPLCWRNQPHNRYTSYCHIEELAFWDKDLAAKILNSPMDYVDEHGYIYHITKASRHVHRIHQKDSASPIKVKEPNQESGRKPYHFHSKSNKLENYI